MSKNPLKASVGSKKSKDDSDSSGEDNIDLIVDDTKKERKKSVVEEMAEDAKGIVRGLSKKILHIDESMGEHELKEIVTSASIKDSNTATEEQKDDDIGGIDELDGGDVGDDVAADAAKIKKTADTLLKLIKYFDRQDPDEVSISLRKACANLNDYFKEYKETNDKKDKKGGETNNNNPEPSTTISPDQLRPDKKKAPQAPKELLFNLSNVVDAEGSNMFTLIAAHYYRNVLDREGLEQWREKNPTSVERDEERTKNDKQSYVLSEMLSNLSVYSSYPFLKEMINPDEAFTKKNKRKENALMFFVKAGNTYSWSTYINMDAEKLDAPFDEDTGASLLAILCKGFDPRERSGIDWLVGKKCDPLKPDNYGQYPMKYMAEIAYPAKQELFDDDDTDADESQKLSQKLEVEVVERKKRKDAQEIFAQMLSNVHPLATLVPKPTKPDEKKEKEKAPSTSVLSKIRRNKNEPKPKPKKVDKEALLLSLYQVSPQSVDVALSKFEAGTGFDGEKNYTKYNFAIDEKGYKAMINSEISRPALLGVLESENTYITKKPAVRALMDALWNNGVRRAFLHEAVVFGLYLISTSLLVNLGVQSFTAPNPWLYVTWALAIFVDIMDILILSIELLHAVHQGWISYLKEFWNYPDWICNLGTLYFSTFLIGREGVQWNGVQRQLFAICVLYLWLKCLEYAGTFKTTSTVSRLFLMMLSALLQYLVVILVFILAFGHSMFLAAVNLGSDADFSNVGMMVVRMYRALMGEGFDFGALIAAGDNGPSVLPAFLYIAFTISGVLLLLNLLIALMTKVFDEVKDNIDTTFYVNRGLFVAKKAQVYILSPIFVGPFYRYIRPSLHPIQIARDKRSEATAGKSRWAHFIRATLFRPSPFSEKPELESDHQGLVVTFSEHSFEELQQKEIDEVKYQLEALKSKMTKELNELKQKQNSTKDVIGNVEARTLLEHSLTNIEKPYEEVRESAVQALVNVKLADDAYLRKLVVLLVTKALKDTAPVAQIGLDVTEKMNLADNKVQKSFCEVLKSDKTDDDILRRTCQVIGKIAVYQNKGSSSDPWVRQNEDLVQLLLKLLASKKTEISSAATLALIDMTIDDTSMFKPMMALLESSFEKSILLKVINAFERAKIQARKIEIYQSLDKLFNRYDIDMDVKAKISELLSKLAPFIDVPQKIADAVSAQTGKHIAYKGKEDLDGVISFLKARSAAPAVTCSEIKQGALEDFLESKEKKHVWTGNKKYSWFMVDFGENYVVKPTHYKIRYASSGNYCCFRSWVLQGCKEKPTNDPCASETDPEADTAWTLLKKHTDDETLDSDYAEHVFQIDGYFDAGFRYFRVVQTGKTKYKTTGKDEWGDVFVVGGFELYGELGSGKTPVDICIDEKYCSFLVSGRDNYPYQLMWICTTCSEIMGSDKNFVCATCKDKCHQGHNLVPKERISAFCDCGSFRGELCKACLPPAEEITQQVVTTLLNQLQSLKDFSQNDDFIAQISAIKENICATIASCGQKSKEIQKALLVLLNDPDAATAAEDALRLLMLGDTKFAAQIVKRMRQAQKPLMVLRLASVVSSLSRLPADALLVLAEKIEAFKSKPVVVLKLIRILDKLVSNNPKKFEDVFPIVFALYRDKVAAQNKWRTPIEAIFQKNAITTEANLVILTDALKEKGLGVDEIQIKTISFLMLLKFNFRSLVKNCSKTWNGDAELQVLHECRTCAITYVCQNCVDECHKGHDIAFYYSPITGVCGCKEKDDKCTIFEKDEKALKKHKSYELYEEYKPKAQKFLIESISKADRVKEFSQETKELILASVDFKSLDSNDKINLLSFFQSVLDTLPDDGATPITESERQLADRVLTILRDKGFDHVIQFEVNSAKRKSLLDSLTPLLGNWNFEYTVISLLRTLFGPCTDVIGTILSRPSEKLAMRVKMIKVFLPENYAYTDEQKKCYLDKEKALDALLAIISATKPAWVPKEERPANYASKPNLVILDLYESEEQMDSDYTNSKYDAIYAIQALKLSRTKNAESWEKMKKVLLTTAIEQQATYSFGQTLITMDDVKAFVEKYDQNSIGLQKIKDMHKEMTLPEAVEEFFRNQVASQWDLDDAANREREEEEAAKTDKKEDKAEDDAKSEGEDDKKEDKPDEDKPKDEEKTADGEPKVKKDKKKKKTKKSTKKSGSKKTVTINVEGEQPAEPKKEDEKKPESDVEEPSAESSNEA